MNRFQHTTSTHFAGLLRALLSVLACMMCLGVVQLSHAQAKSTSLDSREVTRQAQIWIDDSGRATVEQVAANPELMKPIGQSHSFALTAESALWMRIDLAAADTKKRWYLQLSSAAFFNRASLYQRTASGQWKEQLAGDYIPVANWDSPEQTPVFLVDLQTDATVWLRLQNQPAAIAPRLLLLTQDGLDTQRRWSFLLLGGYLGFGLLVLFLGLVHAGLYRDRAFVAYSAYVAFMLLFQMAFTGIGGLYFWPHNAAWNNAAPAIFMLLLTSIGIWFVREACVLARYSKWVDRAVLAWVGFGLLFTVIYTASTNPSTLLILNLFGLLSVILSITLCLWTWRRGERYGGWLFLGFLPVHLGYPFPALRSAGMIADNWLSQYAVLIGSAIEIPLLLYILHMRAKEFNENRARMRAIDQTDPLTGLAMPPVLALRMMDALRRSRRPGQTRTLLLIELSNHAEIVSREGRTMGDRALVVAASRIVGALSDMDTVCRVDNTQFAALIESPMNLSNATDLAQKIIARGLTEPADSRSNKPLRLKVVASLLQFNDSIPELSDSLDVNDVLAPLVKAMNGLARDPKKAIVHLSDPRSSASVPGSRPD
ncbi:7TM diverse intracellular signaling domain-containing protein [Variovorax sp. PCZ-1]|uniref:sensor domain-containing diguanylate cyclase n=1 Tax=Variovorax sp. PCZ-1 TaxID=2835533 RepID=UPI001BCABEB0|nr:7TM diverse intracellular signaling domain-containing protein [Variovorax sp. PCZ-1]MBS7808518.1 diguanylate cyclase [Variovorax sp. PCZ-1]